MKKMNRKGFTLIEIIAVVIIMAILMAIVVPVVTKYINNSKKSNYESSLRNMVSTVNNEIISGHIEDYTFDEENEFLVMPLVCIELEKGDNKKSPFSNYVSAYSFVIAEATENGYRYMVQALDETGYGTYLIKPEEIKIEDLEVSKLSFITEVEGEYSITFKNYSIDKEPYVFTCEALIEDTELPSNTDDELDKPDQNSNLLVDRIKLDNTTQSDTSLDFSKTSEETNTNGLYYTNVNTEEGKTTYYFRGNVNNNYVKFGKDSSGNDILWRIVRINEDRSVRLITQDSVGTSAFNINSDDNSYVGYMYGLPESTTLYGDINEDGVIDIFDLTLISNFVAGSETPTARQKLLSDLNFDGEITTDDDELLAKIQVGSMTYNLDGYSSIERYNKTHANVTDSTIKKYLDNWYINNLSDYSGYLADAGFCNDRSIATSAGLWNGNDTTLGYKKNETYYGIYNRTTNNKTPKFSCSRTNDLFTTTGSSKGNKALTYPIGLITIDEIAYAGGVYRASNNSIYLNNQPFWTMSSQYFGSIAYGGIMNSMGYFGAQPVNTELRVRPVINIKANVKLSSVTPSGCTKQNGTINCPYIIDTNS